MRPSGSGPSASPHAVNEPSDNPNRPMWSASTRPASSPVASDPSITKRTSRDCSPRSPITGGTTSWLVSGKRGAATT